MFVRGGYVYPGADLLYSAGHYGNYWTSSAYDKDSAFFESIDGYGLLPSDYYARYFGQSLRCVALGG